MTLGSNALQVVIGYTVGVAVMLSAFWSVPASLPWLQWATVFLYGPQMLIGLCGAELVGPESVGASEGFLGWVAYLGKAVFPFTDSGNCSTKRHSCCDPYIVHLSAYMLVRCCNLQGQAQRATPAVAG